MTHECFKFLRVLKGLETRCVRGKSDPPPPPDYTGAAAEQGQQNVQTAIANNWMNRPTENTPFGSRNWTQTGTQRVGDYDVPTFESNISFTPEGKQLFDSNVAQQQRLSALGDKAMGGVESALQQPLDLSGAPEISRQSVARTSRDDIVDAMYRRSTRMLDPQYEQLEDQQRTDLANRGFSVGDEGYTKAKDNFWRSRDSAYADARDRAISAGGAESRADYAADLQGANQDYTQDLSARQQGISEILTRRLQPYQELSSLRTGAMPQNPSFQPYGTSSAQPAPTFAGTQAQGNAALQNYGFENANEKAMYQGIMQMAAMAGMATISDARLKTRVKKIGEMPRSGVGLYEYDKFGKRERGVMAQEIAEWKPSAVARHPSGYLMVDYGQLGDA